MSDGPECRRDPSGPGARICRAARSNSAKPRTIRITVAVPRIPVVRAIAIAAECELAEPALHDFMLSGDDAAIARFFCAVKKLTQ
jgi:hypothetical protein